MYLLMSMKAIYEKLSNLFSKHKRYGLRFDMLSFGLCCLLINIFISSSTNAERSRASKVTPILLITPPPIDAEKWDKYCLENFNVIAPRSNSVVKAYGEKVKNVAQEMGCHVVDAFTLLGGDDEKKEAHYGQYLEDGLHLNELGNELLYDVSC